MLQIKVLNVIILKTMVTISKKNWGVGTRTHVCNNDNVFVISVFMKNWKWEEMFNRYEANKVLLLCKCQCKIWPHIVD